jgi:hypothetical protein
MSIPDLTLPDMKILCLAIVSAMEAMSRSAVRQGDANLAFESARYGDAAAGFGCLVALCY